jgi:L-alanine-DL-glutamate epimerase-like enolase superfamily enzyme
MILFASVSFREQPFAKPLQLSSGTITEITEATATVHVHVNGRAAEGRGSMYLSDLWAWPDPALTHAQRDAQMRRLCQVFAFQLATSFVRNTEHPVHPLQRGLRLHAYASGITDTVPLLAEPGLHPREHDSALKYTVPLLARLVCASPFDAAIHDAFGQAMQRSAFRFYDEDCAIPAADALFKDGAVRAIRRFLRPEPVRAVEGWYVVSGTDPLADDFAGFVQGRGFRCFKLKTHGKDPEADARRTVQVFHAARALGVKSPRLSADSNEGNPDADSVLAYLDTLQRMDAEAYAALEYLEQPTGRDIRRHAFDWHAVSARKPVLIDEGLMTEDIFPDIIAQGWGGICLKTCKGHSFNLIAGAWAHEHGLKIAVQDLTNPGLAAIHSCLLAQHTPNINGVELNSPQFTPAANAAWLDREPALFAPTDGTHRVSNPFVVGLGGAL